MFEPVLAPGGYFLPIRSGGECLTHLANDNVAILACDQSASQTFIDSTNALPIVNSSFILATTSDPSKCVTLPVPIAVQAPVVFTPCAGSYVDSQGWTDLVDVTYFVPIGEIAPDFGTLQLEPVPPPASPAPGAPLVAPVPQAPAPWFATLPAIAQMSVATSGLTTLQYVTIPKTELATRIKTCLDELVASPLVDVNGGARWKKNRLGNKDCLNKLPKANMFFPGMDYKKATEHYAKAINGGISSLVHKYQSGYPHNGWYYGKAQTAGSSTPGCPAAKPKFDCDEFPMAQMYEGGPATWDLGKVSLEMVNIHDNRGIGSKVGGGSTGGSFASDCLAGQTAPPASKDNEFWVFPTNYPVTFWVCAQPSAADYAVYSSVLSPP